jgi:archaellum component FlaC
MKSEELTLVSLDQKIDRVINRVNELAEVVNESFSKLHIYLDDRFGRLETRVTRLEERVEVIENRLGSLENKVGSIEKTMATKTQVEVLTDVLRTNGVISRFEARKISKAQPAV